jgi:hypothetical protein
MPLIDTLRSIVGAPHCLAADIDMAPYLTDWRGRYTGRAVRWCCRPTLRRWRR